MTADEARRALIAHANTWAMSPENFEGLAATIAAGGKAPAARAAIGGSRPGNVVGGVGVIPIMGALTRRGSWFSEALGYSSYAQIRSQLNAALADPGVNSVVLWIDSPGGEVSGCPETGAAVAAASRTKPVIAVADGLCASAAYWIASQAREIVAAPSADIGSIGVFMLHVDASRALDAMGLTPTFIVSRASPYKVEGNPLEPLDPGAGDYLQGQVDKIAAGFVNAVARGRHVPTATVRSDFGRGRTLLATDALAAGMVDGIATFESTIASVASRSMASRGSPESRARLLRLRADDDPTAGARERRRRLAALIQDTPAAARRKRLHDLTAAPSSRASDVAARRRRLAALVAT